MNKACLSTFAAIALMCNIPLAASGQNAPVVYDPGMMLYAMSDNGAFAVSTSVGDTDVDNPKGAGGTLVDLVNHTETTITAPSGWAEIGDVTDNGIVVGSSGGYPGYWTPSTQEWTVFEIPQGWGGGTFTAVTPDGRYAVGYLMDSSNSFFVHPMCYDLTTGEAKELANLPKVDMSGIDQHQNLFYGISPDGRYALGQMSQSYLLPIALFSYIYDLQNDTWDPIGFDFDPQTLKFTPQAENLTFTDNQFMSTDGKWVTGAAYLVKNGGESQGGTEAYYPYRYDIENKTFEVYAGDNDANVGGTKITSDGVVLGCSPYGNPYPTAMVRYGKFFISLDQILEQVYGISKMDLIHDTVTGSFQALSADGLTAVMSTYDNCYVITMPEPFAEAAAKVDLLANYSLSIPDGSEISRIGEIQITFDRSIECMNFPQNVSLTDGDGNLVRNALSIALSPSNDHKLVVTFRSTALTPGETYTVTIPASMLWLKEDKTIKSREIKFSYTGRREGPVGVTNITPADGSTLTQFNTNPDFITVTFDTPVAISEDATCTLYNADDGSQIATFSAGASGNQAGFFPTTSYYLYKGSNYKVVISAGAVTDLSGQGGSEEIVLNYSGAYLRTLSDDDLYIFHSDCNDYSSFIFWQSEFNVPSSVPASWGFLSENPWLLVRDNDTSTEWALAAHSMFNPAGESDDWLIIPQINVPDSTTYLQFDAQRYLSSKSDSLKVYIYEDDAVYNYFTMDLENAFKENGDLVFKEIIPAGANDEKMDGEWTTYTIKLKPYVGKNIYIAFVNNNYDNSAIFINDVKVMRDLNFLMTNQTPATLVDESSAQVKGIISVASQITTYKGIQLKLLDSDKNVVDEINEPDITLALGDTYNFTFSKPLDLKIGYDNTYHISLKSGEEETLYTYSVKDLVFEPHKRVVLEEYTGSTCGNCPLGIQSIDHLVGIYPDNFIPITLRTYQNDIYAGGAVNYTTYLGFTAAPSGRINRGDILAPMLQNGSEGYVFYGKGITTSDGSSAYLWADAVQDELNVPAEADIDVKAYYDTNTETLSLPVDIKFALNQEGRSYGVYAVVLEDELPTFQLNYYNSVSDPNLGEWGLGGMYSQQTVTSWKADYVARFVVNGNNFNGQVLPAADFAAGELAQVMLSATMPISSVSNLANCHVVVMLIDRSTEKIVNANTATISTAGITDIESDESLPIRYYDLQGISTEHPQKGHIYIKVIGNKATKVIY